MNELDELVLLQLMNIGKDVGAFITGVLHNDISRDEQNSFAHRLVDIAEAIRARAMRTHGMIVEGDFINVSDGDTLQAVDHLVCWERQRFLS